LVGLVKSLIGYQLFSGSLPIPIRGTMAEAHLKNKGNFTQIIYNNLDSIIFTKLILLPTNLANSEILARYQA
jgi:hypothetical protein